MEDTAIRDGVTTTSLASQGTVSICLLGQPYWVAKLEQSLNQFGQSRLRAFALPLDSGLFTVLRRALTADVLVRVGFRPGARTLRGRAFDALWSVLRSLNPTAVGVFYWLGTDVLQTTEDLKACRLRPRPYSLAQRDFHLADATWLAEELEAIQIHALPKTLALPKLAVGETPDLPETFSVLTYIPDNRYRFYGGESIYKAARALSDTRFDVVGGSGVWVPEPLPNLVFHGWQRDMTSFYRDTAVLVRLLKHDGTGMTAVEALGAARHVIYSHPLPHTLRVAWGDTHHLLETLSELHDLHEQGLLCPNTEGKAYAEEHFDHRRRMEDLISYFLDLAAKRHTGEHATL